MMDHNYHYIIAGLPDIAPDMNGNAPTYESIVASIKEQLSERDLRLVDWLEYGFDEAHLTDHFYHSVARQKNSFLSSWYNFDLQLRNAKVVYLEKKAGKKGTSATLGEWNPEEFEDYARLQQIFDISNLIEREIALDKLRWAKISDINLSSPTLMKQISFWETGPLISTVTKFAMIPVTIPVVFILNILIID